MGQTHVLLGKLSLLTRVPLYRLRELAKSGAFPASRMGKYIVVQISDIPKVKAAAEARGYIVEMEVGCEAVCA